MSWRRRLAVAVEVVGIGALGALLGLLIAGRLTTGVGPFDARLSLRPVLTGGTTVTLPPLGALRLDTHAGPLHLDVEVLSLREQAARDIVADPDRLTGLGEEVRRDLQRGLRTLVLRTAGVTVAGAVALGFLVFRRPRRTLWAGGAGLSALLGAATWTGATFNAAALAEPRYTGLLASAPQAVGDVRDIVERFDVYSRQLGRLVTNVSQLYAVTRRLPTFTPGDDSIRVLHVSDLHLNPSSYDVIASVVDQFAVDAVIDTGDITDHGTEPESRYVAGISRLGVPYVFVKGNHDSARTAASVAAQRGAVVLDGTRTVEVAGLTLLGAADPRFTPDKTTRDDDAPVDVLRSVGERLRLVAARTSPDVVVVHDPAVAEPLRGAVPLVLAGHTHQREASEDGGTRLLTQGSTGGAGLRALEGESPTPLELSVLYFDRATGRLTAYDDIALGGLGRSTATIERHVVDAAPPLTGPPDVPADAEATPLGSPSASPLGPVPSPFPTE